MKKDIEEKGVGIYSMQPLMSGNGSLAHSTAPEQLNALTPDANLYASSGTLRTCVKLVALNIGPTLGANGTNVNGYMQ